ncbi:hypothetical protein EI94DRAFT_1699932 [Lactarius quietus]|nr:hypothetical protein EI94DRAFT_1699932 [Lactarius quietus]
MGEIQTMQPLAAEDNFHYNMHISATGVVVSEDRANTTFVLHIQQYTMGSPSSDDIAVRGFLRQGGKWPNPTNRLPMIKSIVNIQGILQKFESYTASPNHTTTCAVVDVEKMCYIWKPPPKAANTPGGSTAKRKGKMQQKIHACAESTLDSETSATPSTSQNALRKCKARSSEDEVDENV